MKLTLGMMALALAAVSCICVLIVFYVAFGLATAQVVALVPFVGAQVSPRIENWVLGAEEPLEIDDAPLPSGGSEPPLPTLPPFDETPSPLCAEGQHSTPHALPLSCPYYVTQGFRAGHGGIDLANGQCGGAIFATHCGRVVQAGWSVNAEGDPTGYGNLVVITQGNFTTYYAHLSEYFVSVGSAVSPGQMIGLMGSTGHSTGCHLHYEVRIKGVPENPAWFIPAGVCS